MYRRRPNERDTLGDRECVVPPRGGALSGREALFLSELERAVRALQVVDLNGHLRLGRAVQSNLHHPAVDLDDASFAVVWDAHLASDPDGVQIELGWWLHRFPKSIFEVVADFAGVGIHDQGGERLEVAGLPGETEAFDLLAFPWALVEGVRLQVIAALEMIHEVSNRSLWALRCGDLQDHDAFSIATGSRGHHDMHSTRTLQVLYIRTRFRSWLRMEAIVLPYFDGR